MKQVINLILLLSLSISLGNAQTTNEKKSPVGQWNFVSAEAPEEYSSGTITIGFSENTYSAVFQFRGIDYKFIGENVKFRNDSISFSMAIEDEYVSVILKLESNSKMSGKGTYSEGSVPIVLTKSEPGSK